MKKFSRLLVIGSFVIFAVDTVQAQVDSLQKESPFLFEASYTGDLISNFIGGIKTGTTYLGLANVKAGFHSQSAGWWKGGEAFVNIGNTHGGQPSATLVGDFQGVSNIEAGNHIFLYEIWYKQRIGKIYITVGLQDLNMDFAVSENGGLFINSSFGIHSSIANNISSPIFPLTALGVNFKWNISKKNLWQMALFDGTPENFQMNTYNTEWRLNKDQGFMAITEYQLKKSLLKGKMGRFKFGAYYHQHNDTIEAEQKNGGFYFTGDQQISNKLSLFSQIGLSPKSKNKHNHYYSLGLNCTGLINKRPEDKFGLAVAYAGIDGNDIGSEIAVELTYQLQLNKNIYLKPDIQYIINPAGTENKLDNSLVGFIRFGVEF